MISAVTSVSGKKTTRWISKTIELAGCQIHPARTPDIAPAYRWYTWHGAGFGCGTQCRLLAKPYHHSRLAEKRRCQRRRNTSPLPGDDARGSKGWVAYRSSRCVVLMTEMVPHPSKSHNIRMCQRNPVRWQWPHRVPTNAHCPLHFGSPVRLNTLGQWPGQDRP